MKYSASINNSYVDFIGTNGGNVEIDENRFNNIKRLIGTNPSAPDGFTYKLRANTLTWELVELPEPIETDDDATESDYITALQDLGVKVDA